MTIHAWSLSRGANVVDDGVRFSLWAPKATRVAVQIEGGDVHSLTPSGAGVFEETIRGVGAGTDYRYVLDDNAVPDPVSRYQPAGVHGPSRVVDPARYQWKDAGWPGLAMPDAVIYELHVGTFSEEGTFRGVIPHLRGLRELGITAIEIMPVAEFPGSRNWGYDGVHLYAPQSSYGGPEELRALVDAAHREKLAVILDVVYNHVGPEGNYLGSFGPYFTGRYTTPWGQALNYDDAQSDEVRRFIIDNALYWVTEFHVDGLRLDAIHGIFDFSPRHILRDIAESVHHQAALLGRQALVIGESDLNDPRVVRTPEECGYGLDGQWADDLHHAIHAALTGEKNGYYADFGGVTPVANALRTPFVIDGRYSQHRKRRHGAPATGVPRDRFVVCVQNHDQVGNRAFGDRLAALVGFPKSRLAAALLLLSPYVPLLFMGEEYGETNPFQYFVSHGDPELIKAVREGRKKEFEHFGWGDDVPDPQAVETFARSRLDRSRLEIEEHAGLHTLYRDLLRLRRNAPALRPGSIEPRVAHDEGDGWITLELMSEERRPSLMVLFNLSERDRQVPAATSAPGSWRLLMSTEGEMYGGGGGAPPCLPQNGGATATVQVPATSASVYARETPR
ncbi:MAG TPA: malto-oligosyltrehalose trehalohydrolase [Gemmatimonadaceae bacterium]|nr:malto-oligosyltrehalose trehalohydrolase [Gemmatimonadaceae bacterium]